VADYEVRALMEMEFNPSRAPDSTEVSMHVLGLVPVAACEASGRSALTSTISCGIGAIHSRSVQLLGEQTANDLLLEKRPVTALRPGTTMGWSVHSARAGGDPRWATSFVAISSAHSSQSDLGSSHGSSRGAHCSFQIGGRRFRGGWPRSRVRYAETIRGAPPGGGGRTGPGGVLQGTGRNSSCIEWMWCGANDSMAAWCRHSRARIRDRFTAMEPQQRQVPFIGPDWSPYMGKGARSAGSFYHEMLWPEQTMAARVEP